MITKHRQKRDACIHSRGRHYLQRRAFTLVEVLLVLAILGAIASMVIPNLLNRQKIANTDATRISINATEQSLKMFAIDHGGIYPETTHAIDALMQAPAQDYRWNGPYLEDPPTDAWGQNLRCSESSASGRPQVYSVGPDGREGTDDDVFGKKSRR